MRTFRKKMEKFSILALAGLGNESFNTIDRHLKAVEQQVGLKPELLVIDCLDSLCSTDSYMGASYVCSKLRDMGRERGFAVVTAAQGSKAKRVESWRVVADNVLRMILDESLLDSLSMVCEKSRFGNPCGENMPLGMNSSAYFIGDPTSPMAQAIPVGATVKEDKGEYRPKNLPKNLNPIIKEPRLDQVLSELYDLSKPGVDKQRISGLLNEYQKITGKNKPEFMA